MGTSTFDIFSGRLDKNPMWIDSTQGLFAAAQRMNIFAASKPGRYFVYCARTHEVLASVDTSKDENKGEETT